MRAEEKLDIEQQIKDEEPGAKRALALLMNEIENAEYKDSMDLPVMLTAQEKTAYDCQYKAYQVREAKLVNHRGQAFAMIRGQCTQVLLDKRLPSHQIH